MNQILNNTRGRLLLNKYRKKAIKWGLSASDVRPHRLLMYCPLENDKSSISFSFDRRSGTLPLEIRLDENDAFVAYAMGLGLHKVLIVGGKELPALTERVFYPDKTIFNGPVINGVTEQQSLEMVYNGKLQIETEQDIRLKEFDTSMFRTVPRTQSSVTTLPECNGSEIKDIDSGYVFTGGSRNEAIVKLNAEGGNYSAISGVVDAHVNYAVLVLDGLILTGASKKVTASKMTELLGE